MRNPKWGGARKGAGAPRRNITIKIASLQALLVMVRRLCTFAEGKTPALSDDPEWQTLRAHLEEMARVLEASLGSRNLSKS